MARIEHNFLNGNKRRVKKKKLKKKTADCNRWIIEEGEGEEEDLEGEKRKEPKSVQPYYSAAARVCECERISRSPVWVHKRSAEWIGVI